MIKRAKNKRKNPNWEDDSSVFSPAWKDYPPADIDKDPYELYLLKIERDSANNDIVEYFEAYTEYLANRRHDKARKYAKLHQEAIDKRDKLQEKIEKFSKSKNPRCRTFQVKRKVGKKTIQVRRKICNPSIDNVKYELTNSLIGKKVKLYNKSDARLYKSPQFVIQGLLTYSSKPSGFRIKDGSGYVEFYMYDIDRIIDNKIYI